MTEEKKRFRHVTSSDVCRAYELLYNRGLVSFPITASAYAKVDSIVASITGPHFGVDIYPTPEEKAMAYFYFLIKDHPFTDGNKRTSTLMFSIICEVNGLPQDKDFPLDAFAVFIESIKQPDHQLVIKLLAQAYFKNRLA